MPYTMPDGRAVYASADLEALTGCPAGYLGTLNSDAGPVHAFTVRSVVESFDREAFAYGSGVWKAVTWQDRDAVHPALLGYFRDPYGVRDAPVSALASAGYAPDAPLSDEDVTSLLGVGLARVADAAFKRAVFWTEASIDGIKAGYAVALAEMEVEAERNRRAREARKSRGPSQSERPDPFAVSA